MGWGRAAKRPAPRSSRWPMAVGVPPKRLHPHNRFPAVGRQGEGPTASEERSSGMRGGDDAAHAVGVLVVRSETPLFADVLAQALKAARGLRLLAPPVDARGAPRACRRYRPDVVVVEATQARVAGLRELVRPIRGALDATAILLVVDVV